MARSRSSRREKLDRGRRQPSIYSRTQQDVVRKDYKKGFLLTLLVLLVMGVIYLVVFSPLFKITSVRLNSIKYQDQKIVEKIISDYKDGFILNHNLVTINDSGLKKKISEVPGIKSVQISKKYPNELSVNVTERAPAFVWQVLDHKYLVDETGMIWADYEDKFRDSPVVVDIKNIPTEVGKKPVPSEFSQFVMNVSRDFKTMTGFNISKMEVIDTTSELKVYSSSSWYAYFDTTRSAKNELTNLNRILDEVKKSSKSKTLEYVDLRIDNKIFYK